MSRYLYNDPRVPAFVAASVGSTDTQAHTSMGVERDGKIVCGAVIDNYSGSNAFLHFSVAPGYHIERAFLKLLFGFCFKVLNLKRLSASFCHTNRKVLRLGELCGFRFEAKLKDAYPNADALIYVLRPETCRFIV